MKKIQSEEKMKNFCNEYNKSFIKVILLAVLFLSPSQIFAQYGAKWLTAGSFQSYYSGVGSEIEEGRVKEQQDGWSWPAIYPYQDAVCAKGLWIGCKDFPGYPYRIVQVGPRLNGAGEFFPYKHQLIGKFDDRCTVDRLEHLTKTFTLDIVDPNLKRIMIFMKLRHCWDNKKRKILQFSHPEIIINSSE